MTFLAVEQPPEELLVAVAASAPRNPFYSLAYVRARVAADGGRFLVLTLRSEDGTLVTGCPAYLSEGRWSRTLEIESLPNVPAEGEAFWAGLKQLCRARRVGFLEANTYASDPLTIPTLGAELERRGRTEHILNLENYESGHSQLSSQHRRNLNKARKAGLIVRSTRDVDALRVHTALMAASMQRRQGRGESVPEVTQSSWRRFEPFLRTGAAELFQVEQEGTVVSSLFVLLAERGAYYQSAGTSPDGMACGASPFLVHETACLLHRRGLERFNLGGAHASEAGLYRFKTAFGGQAVALEAVRFAFGNPLVRKARTLLRQLKTDPLHAYRLVAHADRFVVYSASPLSIAPSPPGDDTTCVKLSDSELSQLPPAFEEQVERFRRLGYNDAYGVFHRGQIAHVAWLVSWEHDRLAATRNVKLRPGEAEITHCLTAPEFRGRGFYPFAIRSLCQIAGQNGIHTIFMITSISNTSSQAGIEKAGLVRCGSIMRLRSPAMQRFSGLVFRSHR